MTGSASPGSTPENEPSRDIAHRVEYAIEKPSNKLLALAEPDSDTWVGEVKRIRGKKNPLTATGVHALRAEYTRTIELRRLATKLLFKAPPGMATAKRR